MFFHRTIHYLKQQNVLLVIGLVVISIAQSLVFAKGGLQLGALFIGAIIAIPILALLISNLNFGFYTVMVLSFFVAPIQRISDGKISVFFLEIMLWLTFVGLLISQIRTRSKNSSSWQNVKNPITICLILLTLYVHLEFFNPNSYNMIGKLTAIRLSWYNIIGFVIALCVFDSLTQVKYFFKILLVVCLLAAIYGLTQKYIGLLPFEREWLLSSPQRVSLFVIWGNIRSWSFLNDPGNYGLLMAAGAVICFAFMAGPYRLQRKIWLGIAGVLMLAATVTAGTRTAFVMIPFGFGVFGLLSATNIKTVVISIVLFLGFLGVYFGPFYSPAILRVRTAFQGNEDASMNVRSVNKQRIRPYLYSHPFGGGPSTTGDIGKLQAPGHPLAGFPPDSGYLRVGLEWGYIGLFFSLLLYYRASSKSVAEYFKTKDPEKKVIYLAVASSFVALCMADLTQLTSGVKPFDFVYFSYFALLVKLPRL